MQVLKLFVKQADSHMAESEALTLERGIGIVGDSHARIGSPRQVLIVDQRSLEDFELQPGNLSENVLVSGSLESWSSGQVWQIGQGLIRLTFRCEPCHQLETIRKGLAKQIQGRRGWLGMVVKSGTIQSNDAVAPIAQTFPPLADAAKSRFQEFINRVPSGKVVTTADVILALGLARAYYRVLPTFIKKAPFHLPVHRIVASDGQLLAQHIPRQAELLAAEGVEVVEGAIGEGNRWQPQYFHDLGRGEELKVLNFEF